MWIFSWKAKNLNLVQNKLSYCGVFCRISFSVCNFSLPDETEKCLSHKTFFFCYFSVGDAKSDFVHWTLKWKLRINSYSDMTVMFEEGLTIYWCLKLRIFILNLLKILEKTWKDQVLNYLVKKFVWVNHPLGHFFKYIQYKI